MRGPNGETIAADEAKIAYWVNQGFNPISDEQIGAEIAARAAQPEDRGFVGDVNAFVASALGGATVGGTDVLLGGLMNRGQRERLAADIDYAPVASTVGRIGGEIAGSLAAPGSLLSKTPAGALGRLSTRVGESIAGTGLAARTARLVATGATEGAVSNAGQYLGAMALQDKDASAEGFLASMKDGALYGGGAAGVLGIAGEGLVAARRLIPETELTPVAVRRAREVAKQEVSAAVEETRELENVARSKARQMREEWAAADMSRRAELDQIALQKARDLADAQTAQARARQAKLEADASAARSRADAAQTRAEKAKEPKGKRGKKTEEPPPEVATPEPTPDAPASQADNLDSELMRQLQGTKDAIDGGTPLDQLSARRKDQLVEDALNARVAQESPEMARLLKHLDGLSGAREQVGSWLDKHPKSKVRDFEFQEGMRKTSGWVDRVPQGEGNVLLARGRQGEFLGTELERQSFERKVARKDLHRRIEDPLASAEEKAAAQARLAEMNAASDARKTAKEIVGASEEEIAKEALSVDKHVEEALDGTATLDNEIDDATEAIGALEQSSADLADELGIDAPPIAQERARVYRETQKASEASHADTTESAFADAERAARTIELGDATPQAKRGAGLLARAENAGQMLEALQLLGVPVPDASRIPFVGPLLSMYLKAKLAHRALKGFGGKVPRTAETEIARRANDTKAKLYRAADRALEGGGRKLTSAAAARTAGSTAASVLGVQLFDDRDPTTKERKTKKSDSLEEIYLARRDEVVRSQQPGVLRESIRRRIRTADAGLLDALEATESRRLKLIYDKMPKVDEGTQILGKRQAKAPARSDLEQWAKYVSAANDPAGTLEAILDDGMMNAEAAETLQVVYPRLVQDVQQRIIEKAAETDVEIPYRRRIQLSQMLGLPLDDSQSPESAAFMAELYAPKPQAAQPMPGAMPMSPTVLADSGAAERANPETRI